MASKCNRTLSLLREEYATQLSDMPKMILDAPVSDNLGDLLYYIKALAEGATLICYHR